MRLQGQAKAGFFPCPPPAVAAIARFLRPTGPFALLDPCAGEGAAVTQLAAAIRGATPYVIELDIDRAEVAASKVAKGHAVAPCDFFMASVTSSSFDMAWVNPPYDDEIGGGGRVEHSFLQRVTPLLVPGGVLAYVVPQRVIEGYTGQQTVLYLYERYDDVRIWTFPQECRRFNEVILLGKRRKYLRRMSDDEITSPPWPTKLREGESYQIPEGPGPKVFVKGGLTDAEVGIRLAASPLLRKLAAPEPIKLAQPPLPLARGHLAMLITAGQLDGVVHPPGEPPHVIRGTCRKQSYLKDTDTTFNEKGVATTKSVFGEKFVLTVRAVDQAGEMKSFE